MALIVRDLEPAEFALLATIDRSERIDEQYRIREGALHAVTHVVDVAGWYPEEIVDYEAPRIGAVLATPPDLHLLSLEPEDIHLVLAI